MHDGDHAAVAQLLGKRCLFTFCGMGRTLRDRPLALFLGVVAERDAVLHDLPQRDPWFNHVRRKAEHLQVSAVAHDKALLGVKHT